VSCPANPLDCDSAIAGNAINSVAGSAWDQVCKAFADAASQLLAAFGKAFVAMPPVNLGSNGVRNVYAISLGLAAVIAALLLLGQVIRTAATHDGSGLAQGLTGVAKAALAFLLTLTVAATALEAADQLTRFIVTQTFGSVQALSARIAGLVAWNLTVQSTLLLVFAMIGILLTVVLWFEMLLRNAAIAVLVATSPIAAAGQVSKATQAWWPKLASATGQLIILKPVIAMVFCIGLSLTGRSTDVQTLLAGMLVLVLAIIAWPAVARFFTFTSIQVGGGAGLGAVLGFAAARATNGSSVPAGVEPDEFSRRLEARTMTGFEQATAGTSAAAASRSAAAGPAGLAVAATAAAQRAANTLTGRMEQMAGHAGIPGANPYAQPAGTPRPAGYQPRRAIPVPGQTGMPTAPGGPTGPPPPVPPGPGPDAGPRNEPDTARPDDAPPLAQPGPAPNQSSPASGPHEAPPTPQQQDPAPPQPAPPAPEIHHDPPAAGPGGNDHDGGSE
jgi:hypothetical protein